MASAFAVAHHQPAAGLVSPGQQACSLQRQASSGAPLASLRARASSGLPPSAGLLVRQASAPLPGLTTAALAPTPTPTPLLRRAATQRAAVVVRCASAAPGGGDTGGFFRREPAAAGRSSSGDDLDPFAVAAAAAAAAAVAAAASAAAARGCTQHAGSGDLDSPSLATLAAQQQQQQPPSPLPEDLDAMLAGSLEGLATPQFDAYALRHLVHAPPAACTHLSSLRVAPSRVVRRYAVEAASGERCVMTLALEHGGVGAPLPPAADDGQQQQDAQQQPAGSGRGWVLVSATGEPALPGTPARPAPEHPPEAVVAAQLAALRSLDARAAWRFVGLRGRPALGGGADGFYARLESADLAPLLMHGGAATVMRRQRGARVYSEVARVEANGGEWHEFAWTLALQQDGPFEGCWMVESLRALGTRGRAASDGGRAVPGDS